MINNKYKYNLCNKECKDIENNKCMMLDIISNYYCTDDNDECKALGND